MAKHIEFPDSLSDLGAKLIKFPADESNKHAGDGTTTTTILAAHILEGGLKALKRGYHPMVIKNGIDIACAKTLDYLKSRAIPVTREDEILQLARVACNYDEHTAGLIQQAILKTGKHGVINIDEGTRMENHLVFADGLLVNRGFVSPAFITEPGEIDVRFENCLVLCVGFHLHDIKYCKKLLDDVKE